VVDARTQPSSTARVSGTNRISVALEIIPSLNHTATASHSGARRLTGDRSENDSGFNDCGY
jgi:hypothetical protein